MVVPLEAVTENVTLFDNGTLCEEGWTMITGGAPATAEGVTRNKAHNNKQNAVPPNRNLKGGPVDIQNRS